MDIAGFGLNFQEEETITSLEYAQEIVESFLNNLKIVYLSVISSSSTV